MTMYLGEIGFKANENSGTSSAIWAIATIIIVAIVVGGVYYMIERTDKKKQIDINITSPARWLPAALTQKQEIKQMESNGKCDHKGCDCPVTDDGAYCSSFCQDAAEQDLVEIACECGHASCG